MNLLVLAHQTGLNPKKVATTNGGEYHSSLICHDNDSAGIGMLHKWRKYV